MKLCIYTDPHWSTYSSICRQRGKNYSKRLELLIKSLNWVQELATTYNCDKVICAGDFFDRSNINAEELTALNDVKWNMNIPQTFIVGNHEITLGDLSINSLNALSPIGRVIYRPEVEMCQKTQIFYLPYVDNDNIQPLEKIINDTTTIPCDKRIIISHNDIKGIQYGKFKSENGFTLEEIEKCSDLFINGHLHNAGILNSKETIINLGNLCGQNFNEDAFLYRHYACIVDTDTLQVDYYENPFALNFYKVAITRESDIKIKLAPLQPNAVVSISIIPSLANKLKEEIINYPNIVTYKLTIVDIECALSSQEVDIELGKVNHLDKFKEFCLDRLGNTQLVNEELSEVCR